ncbi:aldehyde dehydrogenase family protein [Sphingobium sp. B2]|uniref:aldehyde dehydrogenase family protein n=1 Tax=Sphingobium sp. B2 TaxID=2583228 RepID=UPI0011A74CB1|nr:aldehyde dehydrogenase family protein [Sphingobium sp. B2]
MTVGHNYSMTINGEAVSSTSSIDVINPATEEVFAQAPECSREQLDAAVRAAHRAFAGWSATPYEQRQALVHALGQAILDDLDTLSTLLTREQGKPLFEAKIEITSLGRLLQAQSTITLPVDVAEDGPDRIVETHHVPIGVVAAIVPWNFPMLLSGFKIGPALLTGNTMVLKPSPFTPLTALKLGELTRSILPPGVLNVISGADELGPWLTNHPLIDKISFTGSTGTGQKVMESAAASLKRLTLELGGNDAAIVLPDVDVEKVADKLFWSAFGNNGQICIATKRMYIHKDIYEPLKQALTAYAARIKVGDGAQKGTRIGPINNRPQYDRVRGLIEDSRKNGYAFLTGGEEHQGPGYFIPVTLIDNPPEDSRIVAEEQFGPVLPLLRYDTVDEVIKRANDCEYGLAGSVWSSDEDKALAVARRLKTGTVFINHDQYLSPFAAFGGQRKSGLGVEGGLPGLLEYTYTQTLVRRKRRAGTVE